MTNPYRIAGIIRGSLWLIRQWFAISEPVILTPFVVITSAVAGCDSKGLESPVVEIRPLHSQQTLAPVEAVWVSSDSDNGNGISWGDVDGDGDLDLAVSSYSAPVRMYRNDGAGSFVAIWQSAGTPDALGVGLGDYDGDGLLDLAVANQRTKNQVYHNTGGNGFTLIWTANYWNDTFGVAWGDLDGDENLDLVFANGMYPSEAYRGNGQGGFTLMWEANASEVNRSVALGDFDADGAIDLAFGNLGNPSRVYRNHRNGVFTSVWQSDEADDTWSIAWGDYDGDGFLDLATGTWLQSNRVYHNDRDGNFSLRWSSNDIDGTNGISWGDFDGDGDLDLVTANSMADRGLPLRVYVNDGGASFSSAWQSTEVIKGTGIGLGDVDGDGDLDVALSTQNEGNRVYRNDVGPSMVLRWTSPQNAYFSDVQFGDYDGDGYPDLAVSDNKTQSPVLRIYRNVGTGAFSLAWTSQAFGTTDAIVWADYDADGDLDFAVGGGASTHSVFRNDGSGTFNPVWSTTSAANTTRASVAWGDYDSDGYPDLTLGFEYQTFGGDARIFRNNRNDMFTAVWSSDSARVTSVAWADHDRDGDLDLAVGTYSGGNRVYSGDGSGTFTLAWTSASSGSSPYTYSLTWGDFDGDGYPDLGAGNNDGHASSIYRNDGGSGFTQVWSSPEARATTKFQWGDVDGDGDPDFALANEENQPSLIWRNDSESAGVPSFALVWTSPQTGYAQGVSWADIDQDGDLDLATCSQLQSVRVYTNSRIAATRSGARPLANSSSYGHIGTLPGSGGACTLGAPASSCLTLSGPVVHLPVVLFDAENDPVSKIELLYRRAGIDTVWQVGSLVGPSITGLAASAGGTPHLVAWNAFSDNVVSTRVALALRVFQNPQHVTLPMQRGALIGTVTTAGVGGSVGDGYYYAIDSFDSDVTDLDGDTWSAQQDCNDASSDCTIDCETNADSDEAIDCLDPCIDVDGDGYCVGPHGASLDCDDKASTCTADCATDGDGDGRADCLDVCVDADGDGFGAAGAGVGCTSNGAANCTQGGTACLGYDCNDRNGWCNIDCFFEQCGGLTTGGRL